jgi:hypothetical protein
MHYVSDATPLLQYAAFVRQSRRSVVVVPLLVVLAGCSSPLFPDADAIARSFEPTIRPDEAFKWPSEHHVTLSGEYRLPAGSYQVDFTCTGEVHYRIDERAGTRHGKCVVTGLSNRTVEPSVVGPGILAIDFGIAARNANDFVNVTLK